MEDSDIILLKLHGSIDWFDKQQYEQRRDVVRAYNGSNYEPQDSIFNSKSNVRMRPLVGTPYWARTQLSNLIVLERDEDNWRQYLEGMKYCMSAPLIVSPSRHKLMYLNRVTEFWECLGKNAGIYEQGFTIIGYSLPDYDDYVRVPLFNWVRNYQTTESPMGHKANLKLIDLRETADAQLKYKHAYRFVDWEKTDVHFGGFTSASLDMNLASAS